MSRDLVLTGWHTDITLPSFAQYHNNIHTDHELSIEACLANKCFYNDSNPSINEVSAESGKIRDVFIASKIIHEWNLGKCIFIIYGSGHAIVLERALKELLGS